MGYNRSGHARKQRLKRHKKLITRLIAKEEAKAPTETKAKK